MSSLLAVNCQYPTAKIARKSQIGIAIISNPERQRNRKQNWWKVTTEIAVIPIIAISSR